MTPGVFRSNLKEAQMKKSAGYHQIDQHIHQLCQIIAKVNRTYVPKEADDSHTNLYFDPIRHRIFGRWVDTAAGRIILALCLDQSMFQWLDESLRVINTHDIAARNQQQLELAAEQTLKNLGLDTTGFREKLHFKIPDYPFVGQPYKPFVREDQKEWEHYRGMANLGCYQLIGHFQADGEVRIWPHHFDTGTYVELDHKLGLGFGLAMKDEMAGDAYFYFSGYGLGGNEVNYQNLPQLSAGRWIINEGWKGAILPISEITEYDQQVEGFIRQLGDWISSGAATK